MLPKKQRLKWREFYKNPRPLRKLTSVYLTMFVKKSEVGLSRFAIGVAKFLDKRSTARHRTKRLIAEGIRKSLAKIKQPSDVLVKAKKIIKKDDFEILRKEINSQLGSITR